MRSVFGDVPNVDWSRAASTRCRRAIRARAWSSRSTGRPRPALRSRQLALAAAAREKRDAGHAERVLARRLDELSPDARELAEALSIADAALFSPLAYGSFTQHGDRQRVFLALEELVSARVLVTGGEHYRFSQRGFPRVLAQRMTAQRSSQLHNRVAELLAQSGGDLLPRAEHLMDAGRENDAIQLLCSLDLFACSPSLTLLSRAVAHAERTATLPARVLYRLHLALLSQAAVQVELEAFGVCCPACSGSWSATAACAVPRARGSVPRTSAWRRR
jgi:hypothetical protein